MLGVDTPGRLERRLAQHRPAAARAMPSPARNSLRLPTGSRAELDNTRRRRRNGRPASASAPRVRREAAPSATRAPALKMPASRSAEGKFSRWPQGTTPQVKSRKTAPPFHQSPDRACLEAAIRPTRSSRPAAHTNACQAGCPRRLVQHMDGIIPRSAMREHPLATMPVCASLRREALIGPEPQPESRWVLNTGTNVRRKKRRDHPAVGNPAISS